MSSRLFTDLRVNEKLAYKVRSDVSRENDMGAIELSIMTSTDPVLTKEASPQNINKSLDGLILCVTGKLQFFKNRAELKEKIENLGGKVTDSVSSKTNYLVNNDNNSTSSKNKTAKQLGIPIITEQQLMEMIN
jgi:NAD-dependent DNA ligase